MMWQNSENLIQQNLSISRLNQVKKDHISINIWFFKCWMLDVSRTASYEINLVCLPVRQLLLFLKTGSLVFSDIVHDDSWPWYLVTDEGRFLKKRNWRPKFRPNCSKSGSKLGFLPFSQVWFVSFTWNCIKW